MPVGNSERDCNSENCTAIIFRDNIPDHIIDVSTRGHFCEGPALKSHERTLDR